MLETANSPVTPEPLAPDTETQWLIQASSRLINETIDGQDTGARLNDLAEQFRADGDAERLISEAVGVVALVGLHHVQKGRLVARDILETAPDIIIGTASDANGSADTFSDRLADATEEFCLTMAGGEDRPAVTAIEPDSPPETLIFEPAEKISLDKLARLAKRGNNEAVNTIFKRCQNMTRRLVLTKGYFLPGGDINDFCQEAMIGVFRALENYDPLRGSFATLAEVAINRAVWTAIKQANRGKHTPLNGAVHIDAPPKEQGESSIADFEMMLVDRLSNVEQQVIDKEFFFELLSKLDRLTNRERTAITMFANDYHYSEIADVIGGDDKSVDNALYRARNKLAGAANKHAVQ